MNVRKIMETQYAKKIKLNGSEFEVTRDGGEQRVLKSKSKQND